MLYIFDNGFSSSSGHHYEYTAAVYDEWVRCGGRAAIYSAKDGGSHETGCDVRPFFSRRMHEVHFRLPGPLGGLSNFFTINMHYLSDLKKFDGRMFSERDAILVHTVNHDMLLALYFWYKSLPPENSPFLVLLFRYNNVIYTPRRRYLGRRGFYKFIFSLFDRLEGGGKIIYATDSADLAVEYEEITKKEVVVLPIPHTRAFHGPLPENAGDMATIVYLGDARDEKGYYLIPEAIESAFRGDHGKKLNFIIQSNTSGFSGELTKEAKKRLLKFREGVRIVDRALGSDEFYDLMLRADAVLIPYRVEEYYARTSGIFSEAMAMGKPVIVPGNTWMERQLALYGRGGTIFDSGDAGSLAVAMLEFLRNRAELSERARSGSQKWGAFHNPGNYYDILTGCIERAGKRLDGKGKE